MNSAIKFAAPLVAALAIAACSGGSTTMPGTIGTSGTSGQSAFTHGVPQWKARNLAREVCPQIVGAPTCLALTSTAKVNPLVAGWSPTDLQTRYHLPITKGTGQIVGIVDAYDNPNIASDLAKYRSNFGLPAATFVKYNQEGQQSNYPQGSSGWGTEEDLDVDMVSAACPNCTIWLIEANSSSASDLEASEDEIVKLGATVVSNSWICYGSDNCGDSNFYTHFAAKGVVYLAASGDAGYNQNGAPEAGSNVVSVGGTQLSKSGSTYSESAWVDAGGGCSDNGTGSGITKPSWQHDPSCKYRTDSDVSSESGCSPGVAEYDTYGNSGWIVECGTSAASPLNAAVFALAANAAHQTAGKRFWTAKTRLQKRDLNVITTGNDGSCSGSYLCTAGTGQYKTYSGPTGWGTPKGIGLY